MKKYNPLIYIEVDGGLLGFHEELARPADAEAVVRRLGGAADFDGILVDDVLVRLGEALPVVDVPTEGLEQGVDELVADGGLAEQRAAVLVVVALEELDQFDDLLRGRHGTSTCRDGMVARAVGVL